MNNPRWYTEMSAGHVLVTGGHVWRESGANVTVESRHGGRELLTIQRADLHDVARFLRRVVEAKR